MRIISDVAWLLEEMLHFEKTDLPLDACRRFIVLACYRCVGSPRSCQSVRIEAECVSAPGCLWIPDPAPAPLPPPPTSTRTPTALTGQEGSCQGSTTSSCSDDFNAQRCDACGSDAECTAVSASCAVSCNTPGCSCDLDLGFCDSTTNTGFNTIR